MSKLESWIFFPIWLLLLQCRCGTSKIIMKLCNLFWKTIKNQMKQIPNKIKIKLLKFNNNLN